VDWDEATTVLEGSKSLELPNSGGAINTTGTFTGGSNRYLKIRWRATSSPTATKNLFRFLDSGTERARIDLLNGGVIGSYHGSASQTQGGLWSINTLYYIWFEYEAGSGSDGVLRFYISTSDSKPGSPSITEITNGTSTTSVNELQLGGSAFAGGLYFDVIQVSETAIS
jgi:hypothetical protein